MAPKYNIVLIIALFIAVSFVGIRYFDAKTGLPVTSRQIADNSEAKQYHIVFLVTSPLLRLTIEGFKDKLSEIKEKNQIIEYTDINIEFTQTNIKNAASFIAEKKADLIVTGQSQIPEIVKQIKTVPIISILSSDPVKLGLAQSENGSGNNVVFFETGTYQSTGRRLELFLELMPSAKKILVIRGDDSLPTANPAGMKYLSEAEDKKNVLLTEKTFKNREEMNKFLLNYDFSQIDAVFRYPGTFVSANADLFFILESKIKKPLITLNRTELESGGILSYGPRYEEFGRAGAVIAQKILVNQLNPATTPIQAPLNYELGINERVAKNYGIEIPPSLRAKADYIIK